MLRYKIFMVCLFLICISGIGYVSARSQEFPLVGKVIYLDAGHGGRDPGAFYKNVREKDINLEITKILEQELTKLGATVYQTRYGDYDLSVPYTDNRKRSDLSRRGNMINRSLCDLYLSIHLNAEESNTWHDAQVFYDDIHANNQKIAKIMQKQFQKRLHSTRKYKKINDLYLSKRVKRPGVLLEVGFLSNPNERYLLKTRAYQEKISNAITEGIRIYFGV